MRAKLAELNTMRTAFLDAGTVDVPSLKPSRGKVVLKINMEAYLEMSGVAKVSSGCYPRPDPWLAGIKAAINIYFGRTGKKLLPACFSPRDAEDSDDDDEGDFFRVAEAALPKDHYTSIQKPVNLPQDISISVISDGDDDDTSMVTDDGNYASEEQNFACMTPPHLGQGTNVTP